jgi:hypothetical protein
MWYERGSSVDEWRLPLKYIKIFELESGTAYKKCRVGQHIRNAVYEDHGTAKVLI